VRAGEDPRDVAPEVTKPAEIPVGHSPGNIDHAPTEKTLLCEKCNPPRHRFRGEVGNASAVAQGAGDEGREEEE